MEVEVSKGRDRMVYRRDDGLWANKGTTPIVPPAFIRHRDQRCALQKKTLQIRAAENSASRVKEGQSGVKILFHLAMILIPRKIKSIDSGVMRFVRKLGA
jgi:hypothetical protein